MRIKNMKKLIIVLTVIVSFLFPAISKADANVFVNLGIGVGIPAPVFVVPSPVVYTVPTFASASLVSRISPNTFLSFSVGVPAPVFVAYAPVVVAPPVFTFPTSAVIVEPAPVFIHSAPVVVHPAPVIIKSGPQHIHVHGYNGYRGYSKFEESAKVKGNKVKYNAKHKWKNK
jgi:hypothetical protein